MTIQQMNILSNLKKTTKVKSHEMIGDILTINVEPNILCVVEPDGTNKVSTVRRGGARDASQT